MRSPAIQTLLEMMPTKEPRAVIRKRSYPIECHRNTNRQLVWWTRVHKQNTTMCPALCFIAALQGLKVPTIVGEEYEVVVRGICEVNGIVRAQ
jgi:hypothetical protein